MFALELRAQLQLVRSNLDIMKNFKLKVQRWKTRIALPGVVGSLRWKTDQTRPSTSKENRKHILYPSETGRSSFVIQWNACLKLRIGWKLNGGGGLRGRGAWFASCQMMALRTKSSRPPFSVQCEVLPTPLTHTPLHTPWEEVCCAVATLNQHRPNEVSHLTPSSLSPSHGCQSHNERPSISSDWLTHFDSWESLGPVRSKLPLSKCHHQHIHQPHLWIHPLSLQKTILLQNQQCIHACACPRPLPT